MLLVRWVAVLVLMVSGMTPFGSMAFAQRNNWQQQQQFQLQQQRQQQLLQQQRQQQLQQQRQQQLQQQRMQEQQALRQRMEQQRIQIQQQQRMQQLQQQRLQQLQAQRQQLQQRQAEQQRLQQQRLAQQRNQKQQIDQKRALQSKDDQKKRDQQALAGIKASPSNSAVVPAALQARLGAVAQRVTTEQRQPQSSKTNTGGGSTRIPRSLGAAASPRPERISPIFNNAAAFDRIKKYADGNRQRFPRANNSAANAIDPYRVGGKTLSPTFNKAANPSDNDADQGDPPPTPRPTPPSFQGPK